MKAEDLNLVWRSLDDELEEQEAHRLQQLLVSSPAAGAELKQLRAVRGLVTEHGGGSFSPHFADRVLERITVQAAPAPRRVDVLRLRAWLPSRPAAGWSLAVAIVLLGIGLAFWLRPQTVRVPYGATASVTLPDGSTAELNGGSTLRYGRFQGSGERLVRLDGEAYFDVVHDDRTFVVETFNARVVVQGTRFNVRAWVDDRERTTTVTLEEGRVAVAPREPEATPVVLAPGETSYVVGDAPAAHAPVAVPLDRALAWRTGGLAFMDQSLGSVFNALERRFGVDITFADPELANLPLTYLNPHPVSAAAVLTDICYTHDLHYRRTAHGFRVLPGNRAER